MDNIRVIKRYSNRKLYDTVTSKYVTLNNILDYVKGGDSIQVVSNTTKADITREVLFNALVEQEKTKVDGISVENLINVIRTSGSLSEYITGESQTTVQGGL